MIRKIKTTSLQLSFNYTYILDKFQYLQQSFDNYHSFQQSVIFKKFISTSSFPITVQNAFHKSPLLGMEIVYFGCSSKKIVNFFIFIVHGYVIGSPIGNID